MEERGDDSKSSPEARARRSRLRGDVAACECVHEFPKVLAGSLRSQSSFIEDIVLNVLHRCAQL